MTQHSPTPWLEEEGIIYGGGREIATITGRLSPDEQSANAAHIVHCVNTHDALVEALRAALLIVDSPGDPAGIKKQMYDAIIKAEEGVLRDGTYRSGEKGGQ